MRDRRNANRDRLKNGLKDEGKPAPREFKSQGSYAMKTMAAAPRQRLRHRRRRLLRQGRSGRRARRRDVAACRRARWCATRSMTAASRRTPEVRTNCVRVFYEAGYHVDLPVYRRVVTKDVFGDETYTTSSRAADWKRSDARDVTEWFEEENDARVPTRQRPPAPAYHPRDQEVRPQPRQLGSQSSAASASRSW